MRNIRVLPLFVLWKADSRTNPPTQVLFLVSIQIVHLLCFADPQEAPDRGAGALQEHQVGVPCADLRRPGAAARQVLQGVPGADGQ